MKMDSVLATWFGAGLLPRAPGTWGSLAALPFAWVIERFAGQGGLMCAAAAAFAVGCWAAARYERRVGQRDPQAVVIDEVAGQWLTLAAVPASLGSYAAGLALFRAADILKPWPVRLAERRLPGGLGVMADDILAAVYAGIVLWTLGEAGVFG